MTERRGPGFFLRSLEKSVVGEKEAELLVESAHVLDLLDELQEALDKTGAVVDGKPNPIAVELRQQRLVLTRLLALLPPEVRVEVPTWRTVRARKAAEARWAGHEKRSP